MTAVYEEASAGKSSRRGGEKGMNAGSLLLYLLLPVLLIVGIYRLLAHITGKRATRHGIQPPGEEERRTARVFHDD